MTIIEELRASTAQHSDAYERLIDAMRNRAKMGKCCLETDEYLSPKTRHKLKSQGFEIEDGTARRQSDHRISWPEPKPPKPPKERTKHIFYHRKSLTQTLAEASATGSGRKSS